MPSGLASRPTITNCELGFRPQLWVPLLKGYTGVAGNANADAASGPRIVLTEEYPRRAIILLVLSFACEDSPKGPTYGTKIFKRGVRGLLLIRAWQCTRPAVGNDPARQLAGTNLSRQILFSNIRRIDLLVPGFRVMNAMTAPAVRRSKNGNIPYRRREQHHSPRQSAVRFRGEIFASQQELADLVAKWPANRLIEVWNSIPGLTPVKRFTDRKSSSGKRFRAWAAPRLRRQRQTDARAKKRRQ